MKTQWMSSYLTLSAKYFQTVLLLSHSCLLQVKYFSLFKCSDKSESSLNVGAIVIYHLHVSSSLLQIILTQMECRFWKTLYVHLVW